MVFSNVKNGDWMGTFSNPLGLPANTLCNGLTVATINVLRAAAFSTFVAESIAIQTASQALHLVPEILIGYVDQKYIATGSAILEVTILVSALAHKTIYGSNQEAALNSQEKNEAYKEPPSKQPAVPGSSALAEGRLTDVDTALLPAANEQGSAHRDVAETEGPRDGKVDDQTQANRPLAAGKDDEDVEEKANDEDVSVDEEGDNDVGIAGETQGSERGSEDDTDEE